MSKHTAIVSVIMGSDSDMPVMGAAVEMLEYFSIPYEVSIVSAHRTPARLYQYAHNAEKNGLRIIIAGAGGAAHLPGMVAAITPIPVIGVPVKNSALNGEDSLLSIVQMPPGVPVATMAINGAKNAGILAAQMLSISDQALRREVLEYKKSLESMVLEKARKVEAEYR